MARARTPFFQDPQFDKFLQSEVGDDRNGVSVSVLSMLARLGVDPWREASELASMPEASARRRLDVLMARFSDVPSWVPSRNDVISRLLTLMPQGASSSNLTPGNQNSQSAQKALGTPLYIAVLIASLLAYYAFRTFEN